MSKPSLAAELAALRRRSRRMFASNEHLRRFAAHLKRILTPRHAKP